MRKVLKWPVPVDDKDHPIGAGEVVLVATQGEPNRAVVFVWTEEGTRKGTRVARVYGTGHEILDGDQHLGSVVDEPFVWHVYGRWLPQ